MWPSIAVAPVADADQQALLPGRGAHLHPPRAGVLPGRALQEEMMSLHICLLTGWRTYMSAAWIEMRDTWQQDLQWYLSAFSGFAHH